MPVLSTSADAHIDAPASLVLEILRDFDGHHRRILPSAFSDFEVVHGGHGAGTQTRFRFRLGGRTMEMRTVATEPEPGLIREQVLERDMVTLFRIQDEGEGSHVTISTEWTPAGGLSGRLERRFAPGALHKVYVEELGLIADYATALASSLAPLIVTSAPEPGRTPSAA
jgi:polyketide cyclase/dehydrase/lipid transport protein